MTNSFDQFDAPAAAPPKPEGNPFDQFDTKAAAPVPLATAANPFDQFEAKAPAAPAAAVPKSSAPERASNAFDQFDVSPQQKALKQRWDKAGPLEKMGMMWRGFSYDKSVEQAFAPNEMQGQIPSVDTSGSAPAQVAKSLANTASGVFNSLGAPGVAATLMSPGTGLYAVPYFAKKALDAVPAAWRSYFDPNATAADRTNKTAAAVMDALAVVGLAKTGAQPAAEALISGAHATGMLAAKIAPNSFLADIPRAIEDTRTKLANRIAATPIQDAMAASRDAADNAAERVATQTANDLRGPLRREFGKDAAPAEQALTFQVEALNDPGALDEMRQKVDASKDATPKWKQAALDAIDFAKDNFDRLSPFAEKYSDVTLKQWAHEREAGQATPYRAGYVMHAQDLADPKGFESLSSSGAGEGSAAFRMMRSHDTLADSIAAGVDPKSINAVDLLKSRVANGERLVNRDAWVDSLKDLKDPTNNQPVATNVVVETRPDGTTYNTAPDGYQAETLGSKSIAVQKGYSGIFKSITDPSAWSKGDIAPILQKVNATGKAVNLLLDTFHLGRIAMWDSAIRASGLKTFRAPVPSFRQGLTLMDHSPAEITKMAADGAVPSGWLPKVLENKETLDRLEKNGMNTGRTADAMHQEWVRKIPGIGKFNQFVFEKFQRGATSEIGLLEYERQRAMYPELTDDQVARNVAKDVNTRFGNFGRQGIFKSGTWRDLARMVLLAPQWNEGLIKSEVGAARQGIAAAKDLAVNHRLASGMLARGTATMFMGQLIANQLINMYTRGHPTWKNPEEGPSAKLSAWIPDKIGGGPGFFLNPAALSAEVSHNFEKAYERDPNWDNAMKGFIRGRLSAGARPVATWFFGTDPLGRPIKPDELHGAMAASATPWPIGLPAAAAGARQLVTGQHSESFSGQYQKQLMATVGQKMDNAPSSEQRIYSLARAFNRSKGVPPEPQFGAGEYEPLTAALRMGNKNDINDALESLLERRKPAEIEKHFTTWAHLPFTGKNAREAQFLATLNPEQRDTYTKARSSKAQIRHAAVSSLLGYLAQNKVAGRN